MGWHFQLVYQIQNLITAFGVNQVGLILMGYMANLTDLMRLV